MKRPRRILKGDRQPSYRPPERAPRPVGPIPAATVDHRPSRGRASRYDPVLALLAAQILRPRGFGSPPFGTPI
jgi:hypothetical protein